MGNPYIWGSLDRAVNDNTKIDEAIADAIDAHNDNPDAHLEAGQALTTHRAAEIIDHVAESVVNDKITPSARAYTAIVDPSTGYDYDTISSALAYVISKGGGTILIKAGSHFVSTTQEIPRGVSLAGEGVGVTNVYCSVSSGVAFDFDGGITETTAQTVITDISFVRSSGTVLTGENQVGAARGGIYFERCSFEGGGEYGVEITRDFIFTDCTIDMNTTAAFSVIEFNGEGCVWVSSGAGIAMTQAASASAGARAVLYNCEMSGTGSALMSGTWSGCLFINTKFGLITNIIPGSSSTCIKNRYVGCEFIANDNNDLYIDGSALTFTSNSFTAETYDENTADILLRSSSQMCLFSNNYVLHLPSDAGTRNIISANVEVIEGTPPSPAGENVTQTVTRNVSFSPGVTNGHPNMCETGEYYGGKANTSPSTTTKIYRWNGSTYASIYSNSETASTYTRTFWNKAGSWLCFSQNPTTTSTYLVVYRVIDGVVTRVISTTAAPVANLNITALNSAGTGLLGMIRTGSRNVYGITRASTTLTFGSAYTLPAINIGGTSYTPNADTIEFSRDDTRAYVRAGGGEYLYVLGASGTTLSYIFGARIHPTARIKKFYEKPNKNIVCMLDSAPYIIEYTYDNGSYSIVTSFNGTLENDMRAVTQFTLDGSLLVYCLTTDFGNRVYALRKINDEYVRSDNYLSVGAEFMYGTGIDANSGTVVMDRDLSNQISIVEFD